ncbi:hypothetical protein XA68_16019 [Ophiocordyceps unilateralis]|uniref:Uncharacterized protein n=1 Tax=Ophiocordyceps unilateralis TaxID=268505 RepID=A0A2A9P701_OPHUN|nr:hypothetical protein XA68_16019 [Ophiocordyceps unilateralis]
MAILHHIITAVALTCCVYDVVAKDAGLADSADIRGVVNHGYGFSKGSHGAATELSNAVEAAIRIPTGSKLNRRQASAADNTQSSQRKRKNLFAGRRSAPRPAKRPLPTNVQSVQPAQDMPKTDGAQLSPNNEAAQPATVSAAPKPGVGRHRFNPLSVSRRPSRTRTTKPGRVVMPDSKPSDGQHQFNHQPSETSTEKPDGVVTPDPKPSVGRHRFSPLSVSRRPSRTWTRTPRRVVMLDSELSNGQHQFNPLSVSRRPSRTSTTRPRRFARQTRRKNLLAGRRPPPRPAMRPSPSRPSSSAIVPSHTGATASSKSVESLPSWTTSISMVVPTSSESVMETASTTASLETQAVGGTTVVSAPEEETTLITKSPSSASETGQPTKPASETVLPPTTLETQAVEGTTVVPTREEKTPLTREKELSTSETIGAESNEPTNPVLETVLPTTSLETQAGEGTTILSSAPEEKTTLITKSSSTSGTITTAATEPVIEVALPTTPLATEAVRESTVAVPQEEKTTLTTKSSSMSGTIPTAATKPAKEVALPVTSEPAIEVALPTTSLATEAVRESTVAVPQEKKTTLITKMSSTSGAIRTATAEPAKPDQTESSPETGISSADSAHASSSTASIGLESSVGNAYPSSSMTSVGLPSSVGNAYPSSSMTSVGFPSSASNSKAYPSSSSTTSRSSASAKAPVAAATEASLAVPSESSSTPVTGVQSAVPASTHPATQGQAANFTSVIPGVARTSDAGMNGADSKPTSVSQVEMATVVLDSVSSIATSCPSSTNCGYVTRTVPAYTVICPADMLASPAKQTSSPESSSHETVKATLTAKVTVVYTIMSCPQQTSNTTCSVGSTATQHITTTYRPNEKSDNSLALEFGGFVNLSEVVNSGSTMEGNEVGKADSGVSNVANAGVELHDLASSVDQEASVHDDSVLPAQQEAGNDSNSC